MTLARLWGRPSCLAGALGSYSMLPCPWLPRLAPCQVTEPSHGCLPQPVSGSATTCQVARSGVASSSPARVRPSSSAPSGRVLVPCVGQPPLAITHLPLLLLPPAFCMCLLLLALGLKLRKEQQARRDTRGRGPGICFKKLCGDLYTRVRKSACDP